MAEIKCEICGNTKFTKTDDDMFKCDNCGCKYTHDQVKRMLNKDLEKINEKEQNSHNSELKRLVQNARTHMRLGHGANDIIEEIIKNYPSSSWGYWLYLKQEFKNVFESYKTCINRASFSTMKEMYNSLLETIDEDNDVTKEEIINYWNRNFEKIYLGLVSGEFSGIDQINYIPDFEAHKLLDKAYKLGIKNAKILNNNKIFINKGMSNGIIKFFYDTTNVQHRVYENLKFIFGKKAVIYGAPYCSEEVETLDFCVEDIESILPRIMESARVNTLEWINKNNKCLCGTAVTKKMFRDTLYCPKCKVEYNII